MYVEVIVSNINVVFSDTMYKATASHWRQWSEV